MWTLVENLTNVVDENQQESENQGNENQGNENQGNVVKNFIDLIIKNE